LTVVNVNAEFSEESASAACDSSSVVDEEEKRADETIEYETGESELALATAACLTAMAQASSANVSPLADRRRRLLPEPLPVDEDETSSPVAAEEDFVKTTIVNTTLTTTTIANAETTTVHAEMVSSEEVVQTHHAPGNLFLSFHFVINFQNLLI
jgi:hypothetical protein